MNDRGSFLIAALWAVSLFLIMTASLVFNSSQRLMMMKAQKDDFRRNTDFLSVFSGVCSKISADAYPYEDSAGDAWYGTVSLPEPFLSRIDASVTDEEAKININEASERLLKTVFKNMEENGASIRGEEKDYIKYILDLRSKGRIRSLEELLLLEDFEREDIEVLKNYLTAYTESHLVNINTADPLVLSSLIMAIPGDTGTKQLLSARLKEARNERTGAHFYSRDLSPAAFREHLSLPLTVHMDVLIQEFLSKVTTDSETFKLAMHAPHAREAEMIFRFRPGQVRPEVFYWHEN